MKTRQWFVQHERRPAPDLEAVQQAVLAAIGRTEFARDGDGTRGRPRTGHGSDGSGTTGTAGTNEFGSDGTDETGVADGVVPVPVSTVACVTTTASASGCKSAGCEWQLHDQRSGAQRCGLCVACS